jgi:hypothetical protein
MGDIVDWMFQSGMLDAPDADEERVSRPRCKFCNKGPFDWHHTGVRWVLLDDDGKIHRCSKAAPASADEFPEC